MARSSLFASVFLLSVCLSQVASQDYDFHNIVQWPVATVDEVETETEAVEEAAEEKPSFSVIRVEPSNWQALLDTYDEVFVLFSYPHSVCAECVAAEKELDDMVGGAPDEFNERVVVAVVNCVDMAKQCETFGLTKYPTALLFSQGKAVIPYEGILRKEDIQSLLQQSIDSQIARVVSDETFKEQVLEKEGYVVLGIFPDTLTKGTRAFQRTAIRLRLEHSFAICDAIRYGNHLAEEHGIEEVPAVLLFRNGKVIRTYPDEEITRKRLVSWLSVHTRPLIQEYHEGMPTGNQVLILWMDGIDTSLVAPLETLAEDANLRARFDFIYADKNKYESFTQVSGLADSSWPRASIHDKRTHAIYHLAADVPITEETLQSFLNSFIEGTLEPFVRSVDISDDKSNVETLSYNSWRTRVIGNSKQTMIILFYEPTSEYSIEFLPIFEEVAVKAKEKHGDLFTFAKYDMENNDTPPSVPFSTPIVRHYGAEVKKGEQFVGRRQVEPLLKWLDELAQESQLEFREHIGA